MLDGHVDLLGLCHGRVQGLELLVGQRKLEVVERAQVALHLLELLLQLVERGGQLRRVLLEVGHRLDRVGLLAERTRDLLELDHDLLALLLDLRREQLEDELRDLLVLLDEELAHRGGRDPEEAEAHLQRHLRLDGGHALLVLRHLGGDLPDGLLLARELGEVGVDVEREHGVVRGVLLKVGLRARQRLLERRLDAAAQGGRQALVRGDGLQHGRVRPEEVLHDELLELRDVLHRVGALVEDGEHHVRVGLRRDAVGRAGRAAALLVRLLHEELEREERRRRPEQVRRVDAAGHHGDLGGRDDRDIEGGAVADEGGVGVERVLGHEGDRVLHDEVDGAQQPLELGDGVDLAHLLVEVVPALAHLLERRLDAVLERRAPRQLEVLDGLQQRRRLRLLELLHGDALGEVGIVELQREGLVALGAHLDETADDLALREQRVEAEALLLLEALVRGHLHHAAPRHRPLLLRRRHRERPEDGVRVVLLGRLGEALEDDGGHGAAVLHVDLVEQARRVEVALLEPLGVECEGEHAVDTLLLERRQLLRGHRVHE